MSGQPRVGVLIGRGRRFRRHYERRQRVRAEFLRFFRRLSGLKAHRVRVFHSISAVLPGRTGRPQPFVVTIRPVGRCDPRRVRFVFLRRQLLPYPETQGRDQPVNHAETLISERVRFPTPQARPPARIGIGKNRRFRFGESAVRTHERKFVLDKHAENDEDRPSRL